MNKYWGGGRGGRALHPHLIPVATALTINTVYISNYRQGVHEIRKLLYISEKEITLVTA